MNRFLNVPYVPERPVSLALIGDKTAPFRALLRDCGVETIALPPVTTDDPAVQNHADLSVFHAGSGVLFCSQSVADAVRCLSPKETHIVPVGGKYPNDCALNIAWLINDAFGLEQGSAMLVRNHLFGKGVKWHPVQQGYANCSVCPVGPSAAITDDPSIYASAVKAGLDVLFVKKGDVRLPGHDYGFIGGASAMIGPKRIVFFGDLSTHCDCERIKAFLFDHKCTYRDLPGVPLTDIGGIVPMK